MPSFHFSVTKLKTESPYEKEVLFFQYPSGNRFTEEFRKVIYT